MSPGRLVDLGGFYLAPGYSSEYMHVYLATDLVPDPLARDADEVIEIEKLTRPEVVAQLRSGGFQDAKTLAALQMAGMELGIQPRS